MRSGMYAGSAQHSTAEGCYQCRPMCAMRRLRCAMSISCNRQSPLFRGGKCSLEETAGGKRLCVPTPSTLSAVAVKIYITRQTGENERAAFILLIWLRNEGGYKNATRRWNRPRRTSRRTGTGMARRRTRRTGRRMRLPVMWNNRISSTRNAMHKHFLPKVRDAHDSKVSVLTRQALN